MDEQNSIIPMSDPRVIKMGRTESTGNGAVKFSYPGVTFKFQFSGSRATLLAESTSGSNYIDIFVDDAPGRVVKPDNKENAVVLPDGNQASKHTVEIVHRNETWQGIVTFKEIEIKSGNIVDPPSLPDRK